VNSTTHTRNSFHFYVFYNHSTRTQCWCNTQTNLGALPMCSPELTVQTGYTNRIFLTQNLQYNQPPQDATLPHRL